VVRQSTFVKYKNLFFTITVGPIPFIDVLLVYKTKTTKNDQSQPGNNNKKKRVVEELRDGAGEWGVMGAAKEKQSMLWV